MNVSIQQAAVNTLAAHLTKQLPDVRIEDRWPDPQRSISEPTITILKAGPRRDLATDFIDVGLTNVGSSRVSYQTQIAMIEQPLQLDIWANNQFERDDILGRLDFALNMDTINVGEIMHGLNLLALPDDGWSNNTYFDYWFESPREENAPFEAIVEEWRATVSGRAWGMLAVPRTTSRQAVINFILQVQNTDFVTATT